MPANSEDDEVKQRMSRRRDDRGVVLVTGAAGFTGSTAVDYLLQYGYPVLATDLPGANYHHLLRHKKYMNSHPRKYRGVTLEIIPSDVTRPHSLKKLFKDHRVEYIMHPAGLNSMKYKRDILRHVYVDGTRALLDVAASHTDNLRGVAVWSTITVYGNARTNEPVTEDITPNPCCAYSEAKLEQENVTREFAAGGLPTVILRPTAVYGPRGESGIARSLKPFIWSFIVPLIPIPGKGDSIVNFVHIDDVVGSAMHLLYTLQQMPISGQVFNVTDDTPVTLAEAFRDVATLLDVEPPEVHIPESFLKFAESVIPAAKKIPFFDVYKEELSELIASYLVDNSRLKSTGYTFKYPDTAEGMKSTIEWFARNRRLEKVWYMTHPGWEKYFSGLDTVRPFADYDIE